MSSNQSLDLRAELTCGDPSRQSRALLAVLGLLSAGRDVTIHVSVVCQAVLGNPNVTSSIKCTAYDLAAAASLSDADQGRMSAAIVADLQKGSPAELRTKALAALAQLPSHRLVSLLGDATARGRIGSMLRSPSAAVRAAAIDALGAMWTIDAVPAAAHEDEGIGRLLDDGVAVAAEGLCHDDPLVVQAACRALAALFQSDAALSQKSADGSAPPQAAVGSEAANASAVRAPLADSALMQVGSVFGTAQSRFRKLPVGRLLEVPPLLISYLRALRARSGVRPLDTLPGDAALVHAHAFEESVGLLGDVVGIGDPAAVLAATQGLLELAELDASSATLQALLPSAVSAAVGAARGAGGHQRTVAEHAVLSLLLRHLEVLPTVQRVALFQLLPPMIATMPAAADRVRAFFQLWSAAAAYDWTAGVAPVLRTTPGAPPAAPTPQLQLLLLDRHIKDAISGTSPAAPPGSPVLEGLDPPHPRYRDPVFREELVGCLLHVLLTHPRPAAAADDSVAGASSAITRASVIQAASAAVDWLGSAKVALQGTKPCLGWDRVAGIATTGTTAAVDLWLQLLLRCIQVSQGLKDRLKGVGPPPQAAAAGQNGDAMIDPGAAALAALVHRAGELEGELQGMLLQIAANWRALHPVARPRAVWLCASHLRLRSVLDAAWTSLADALRGLLSTGKGADVGSYYAAVSQGSLRAKGEEDGAGGGSSRHDAAVAAGAGETEEVALLSLERLAGLVVSNHRGQLVGELAPVATMLEKLASMQAEAAGAAQNPAIAERLARVQLLLKPVATAARKKPAEQGKRASKDGGTDESAAGPVVVELIPDPLSGAGGYAAASYPSTLPPFRSLVGTAETVRYRCFLEQLQVAALAKSLAAADAEAGSPDAPQASRREVSAGLPTVNQLASLLEGPSPSASGVQVTGPATPVSLTLSHSIDPGAGTIRLRCCAANLTLQPLAGVEVTLLLGGPVAGANRRPLNYRLAPLPPGDTAVWEVPLLVSGFGWPTVQPAVTLPAAVPLGVPSLRCRPYSISPLQLLAPPATSLSPSEFYQRWQALSNRACVAAAPTDPTPLGIQRLLAAIEAAGLDCVMKAVVPVAGGVHAAFHGASWSGESIAVVVTSVAAAGSGAPSSGPAPPVLHLHFGSEAPEVVAHIRGHEGEMLSQLTAGLAVPAAAPSGGGVAPVVVPGGDADEAPEERARPYSTFSFLRSVTAQMEEKKHEEDGVAAVEAAAREAAAEKETQALATAAVRQWERLRALRVAAT